MQLPVQPFALPTRGLGQPCRFPCKLWQCASNVNYLRPVLPKFSRCRAHQRGDAEPTSAVEGSAIAVRTATTALLGACLSVASPAHAEGLQLVSSPEDLIAQVLFSIVVVALAVITGGVSAQAFAEGTVCGLKSFFGCASAHSKAICMLLASLRVVVLIC